MIGSAGDKRGMAKFTVAAAQTNDLSFSSSGTVTAVDVKAGDEVKAGQVLATIDSTAAATAFSSFSWRRRASPAVPDPGDREAFLAGVPVAIVKSSH